MKRVLYFESSLNGKVGGSHHSLLLMLKHLDASKYEKVVVLNSDNALRPELERYCEKLIIWKGPSRVSFAGSAAREIWDEKLQSWPSPLSNLLTFVYSKSQILLNDILKGALLIGRYFRLLRRERIDILHLNNGFDPYWTLAGRLARVPVIQHVRGSVGPLYPPICHLVTKVVCISHDVKNKITRRGINPRKAITIHNAIDTVAFRPTRDRDAIRSELGVDSSSPVVAIFGNIQRWKGQHLVIQACEKLSEKYPSIRCILFGEVIEEDYAAELESLARAGRLNGQVIHAGYRADVADCMDAADIIVHASTSPEPFGRVIIEAMSLGKPVVAANDGAVPEIIEDGISGLLFKPGNTNHLTRQVEGLLLDHENASLVGQNARTRVCRYFDVIQQVAEITDIYEGVLRRSCKRLVSVGKQ